MTDEARRVQEATVALSPDKMLGLDIPRTWCTGAQVFVNGDFSLLVFREQNLLAFEQGIDREPEMVIKNVASVVMPTPVARELSALLIAQLNALDANGQS